MSEHGQRVTLHASHTCTPVHPQTLAAYATARTQGTTTMLCIRLPALSHLLPVQSQGPALPQLLLTTVGKLPTPVLTHLCSVPPPAQQQQQQQHQAMTATAAATWAAAWCAALTASPTFLAAWPCARALASHAAVPARRGTVPSLTLRWCRQPATPCLRRATAPGPCRAPPSSWTPVPSTGEAAGWPPSPFFGPASHAALQLRPVICGVALPPCSALRSTYPCTASIHGAPARADQDLSSLSPAPQVCQRGLQACRHGCG